MNASSIKSKNKASQLNSVMGLTNENATTRAYLKIAMSLAIWSVLSATTYFIIISTYEPQSVNQSLSIVVLSVVKYPILLFAIYKFAQNSAARYLNDIFELENVELASNFIGKVAFGGEPERITLDKGGILEEETTSHLLRIGGPGEIKVNLGNIAIYEGVNGNVKILKASEHIWEINGFERLREVRDTHEDGKRKYAIIETRDHFVSDLSLVSRTKDGIPLQIDDIKLNFSILRKSDTTIKDQQKDPFMFDENAAKALVYQHNVMSKSYDLPTGIQFPWDTTIIPLVLSELEKLIQTYTFNEIFTSIGNRELAEIHKKEDEVKKIYEKITDNNIEMKDIKKYQLPVFIPRPAITQKFYSIDFQEKAAKMGISLNWIDVGTWQINERFIFVLDKLKEALTLKNENKKLEQEIKKIEENLILKEIARIVDEVIITTLEKNNASVLSKKDLEEIAKVIRQNPQLSNPYLVSNLIKEKLASKNLEQKIINTLKAFHIILLETQKLTDPKLSPDEIEKINLAIHNIERHIFHFIN